MESLLQQRDRKICEDLEKLLFLWQEETEERIAEDTVSVDGEIRSKDGLTYSRLVIGQNQ